jgi:hypothetical protein
MTSSDSGVGMGLDLKNLEITSQCEVETGGVDEIFQDYQQTPQPVRFHSG